MSLLFLRHQYRHCYYCTLVFFMCVVNVNGAIVSWQTGFDPLASRRTDGIQGGEHAHLFAFTNPKNESRINGRLNRERGASPNQGTLQKALQRINGRFTRQGVASQGRVNGYRGVSTDKGALHRASTDTRSSSSVARPGVSRNENSFRISTNIARSS